tara:strand:+ start:593 stop:1213 length:621 start_codon:yes stop_codon:yes gene_type:complete
MTRVLLKVVIISLVLLGGCQKSNLSLLENSCSEVGCIHPLDALKSINLSRLNYVKQLDQKGCGAAAISSLLEYWDKSASYESIVLKYPSASTKGYAVGELKYIASEYGLAAYSLQMSEKSLRKNLSMGRPIIIAVKKYIFDYINVLPNFLPFKEYITYSHYLVVFGYNDEGYWVMDPAKGYYFVTNKALKEMWSRQKFVSLLISSK